MKNLDAIFKPQSIAIIGATPRPGSIGREILRNLFDYEFNGTVFPVNPKYQYIHSTKAYPTILSIPDPVDMAVIVVRKELVLQAADDCGRKGVKGLVIISAGFKEVGGEGLKRERKLVEIVRKYDMRLIGPNCMGVINATPECHMNATFSPVHPVTGNLAFMTQSGALGVAILLAAHKLSVGLSYFASVGNKADVSGTDLLEYWENDEAAGVIAMYLESFGDPERFTDLAKRITRKKPMVVVKSGTTAAGARAASSHTGSLAGLEVAADALLHQCGVLRVGTIEEMIDLVAALTRVPMPHGNRLCIMSNAGGPAIMAADIVEAHGLALADLSDESRDKLRDVLPPEASTINPIDMVAGAGPEEFAKTLEVVLQDPGVDMAITIFVPPLMIEPISVMRNITDVGRLHDKPVLSVLMAEESYYERIPKEIQNHVPFYEFPEAAVKVAAEMYRWCEWRDRPAGEVREFEADRDKAAGLIKSRADAGGGYLSQAAVFDVLAAYGLPVCKRVAVGTDGDLVAAANEIGYPVALKVEGEALVHKSDLGGVALDIGSDAALKAAHQEMTDSLASAGVAGDIEGYLLQEMVPPGREVILGMTRDPKFGPLLMFGMGGKYVEILRDVSFRVMPVTDVDARDMVRRVKSYPLLEGVRGEEGVDIDFIIEAVERLAQLVRDLPGIAELDINPVIVTADRGTCRVVDARIRVGE